MTNTNKVLTITLEFDLEGHKTSKARVREAWAAATTVATEAVAQTLLAHIVSVKSQMSYDYRYLLHTAVATAPQPAHQPSVAVETEDVNDAVNEEIGNGTHKPRVLAE